MRAPRIGQPAGRATGRQRAAVGAGVLLTLAGCARGSSDDPTVQGPPASPSPTSPPTASPSPAAARLVLRAGGIGDRSFGAAADDVVMFLTGVLGPPAGENTAAECESGADRTVQWTPLIAVFAQGRWVGYSWDGGAGAPPAGTEAGIEVGSTVAKLEAAYPGVMIEETSIGWEWFAESESDTTALRGVVGGPEDDDTVRLIGSGDICAFR